MPSSSSYSIWSTTTIILVVDGDYNMVRGDLRHSDRSSSMTNTDSFNVHESTVSGQPLSILSTASLASVPRSTTFTNTDSFNTDLESTSIEPSLLSTTTSSLAPTLLVPPNPSAEHPDYDTDRRSSISELPDALYQTVDVAVSTAQNMMETSSASFLDDGQPSPPHHQSSTEASGSQLPMSPPQTNKFKAIRMRIKHRLKRAFNHFRVQHR